VTVPSKPPVKVESREPKSIRFSPAEWAAITEAALARGLEPSRFARGLSLIGLKLLAGIEEVEAYRRHTDAASA
jgi:hypothetical protein